MSRFDHVMIDLQWFRHRLVLLVSGIGSIILSGASCSEHHQFDNSLSALSKDVVVMPLILSLRREIMLCTTSLFEVSNNVFVGVNAAEIIIRILCRNDVVLPQTYSFALGITSSFEMSNDVVIGGVKI